MRESLINVSYIAASILFIFGLKMLSSQKTARKGNLISALGMLIAVVATLVRQDMRYEFIIGGAIVGGVIGAIASVRVPMTSMPEFVALFNGFGGIASLCVGWAEYHRQVGIWAEGTMPEGSPPIWYLATAIFFTLLIGGVTFSGSIVAYAKLAGRISGKPVLFKGQHIVNLLVFAATVVLGVVYVINPSAAYPVFIVVAVLALVLGILSTIPIGGADMPVVICLLNSYSGLAACASGFVISNNVLIVSGSLVGASGIILTAIMCKAMNRSLANVLFGGLGATGGSTSKAEGEATVISPQDAYYVLEAASSVVFVPGYGMAVAQAQHVVRELGEILEENGAEVSYAIHPVAGRMPGHMNVLLAEANVPYEQLVEMDDVNPMIETVDVAIVIGANDVVNPAAREQEGCAIYGMPIINVDHAHTCFVLKRSLASGFAGVDNPLFFKENTRMLLGDAKVSVQAVVAEFKES
ncbi:MAG: NAD(P)(+) transhydrogenase (Re/Si-specific) subunit beta [bacterium]|nr:NAD(P)(+) transhydrogenase (Re/Si-specific) subunit beta [bacterium]